MKYVSTFIVEYASAKQISFNSRIISDNVKDSDANAEHVEMVGQIA